MNRTRGRGFAGPRGFSSLLLVTGFLLSVAVEADAHRTLSVGPVGSVPRAGFDAGWKPGKGGAGTLRWSYWRSIDASVSLSVFDHAPKNGEDPDVLLAVWTLGVRWRGRPGGKVTLDAMLGAESHTALFHRGWKKYVGNKGYDETDVGFSLGIGLERMFTERWGVALSVQTHTVFTRPERVRYETVGVGLVYVLSP